MRSVRAVIVGCALAVLWAPAAWGLGISVPAASVGSLKPGATATSAASTIVISGLALEGWNLRVEDPIGDGHMVRSNACSLGVASLASPLHLAFSGGLLTTTFDRAQYDLDSASNPVVAHGTTPDTFSVVFSQAVGSSEVLAASCGYSLTIRYTVSAA